MLTKKYPLLSIALFISVNCWGEIDCTSSPVEFVKDFDPLFCQNLSSAPSLKKGLTPKWNHEYVGIDLGKEFLTSLKHTPRKTFVGVIEFGFSKELLSAYSSVPFYTNRRADEKSEHASKVVHLIFDPEFGSSSNGSVGNFIETNNGDEEILAEAVSAALKFKSKLLNISGAVGKQKESLAAWKEIVKEGKIVVVAAGNSYPRAQMSNLNANKFDNILIGNLDFSGFPTPSSSESDKVTILVPCDHYGLSKDSHGKLVMFDGTSCSTPIATGVFADALSILPELNQEDLKLIIEKTSIPTRIQKDSSRRMNGSGMLNAYKLLRVVQRLKERGYPKNRLGLLQSEKIFDFKDESKKLMTLSHKPLDKNNRCISLISKLKAARGAYLLNPNDEIAQSLASLYREMKFPINATFYDSLVEEHGSQASLRKLYADKTPEKIDFGSLYTPWQTRTVGDRALIYASRLDENNLFVKDVIAKLEENSKSASNVLRLQSIEDAKFLGPHGVTILKKLSQDKDINIREKAKSYLDYFKSDFFTYADATKLNSD